VRRRRFDQQVGNGVAALGELRHLALADGIERHIDGEPQSDRRIDAQKR